MKHNDQKQGIPEPIGWIILCVLTALIAFSAGVSVTKYQYGITPVNYGEEK